MSFGMIFTIILIIVFIVAAFFAIRYFLNFQKQVEINQFNQNVQEEITNMYKSQYGEKAINLRVPSKAEKICFRKILSKVEMTIHFSNLLPEIVSLEHVDIEKTFLESEEFCKEVADEKVKFALTKEYGEILVSIS